MGPRSADRGNLDVQSEPMRPIAALQWGRDQLIAEMSTARCCAPYVPASMGPRSADRGNDTRPMQPRIPVSRFNEAAIS